MLKYCFSTDMAANHTQDTPPFEAENRQPSTTSPDMKIEEIPPIERFCIINVGVWEIPARTPNSNDVRSPDLNLDSRRLYYRANCYQWPLAILESYEPPPNSHGHRLDYY